MQANNFQMSTKKNRTTMFVLTIVFVFMFFLITSCGPSLVWTKKGGFTQQEWANDKYECMNKSQTESYSATGGWGDAYGNCYPGRANRGVYTNTDLFNACMEARGWMLVPQQQ